MKTLKAILVVLFAAAVTTNLSAQKADTYKGQWSITPTVGLGGSNWMVDGDKDLTDEGFAWTVGANVEYSFNKTWSVNSGIRLVSLNSDFKDNITIDGDPVNGECIHQMYLELPILAGTRFRLGKNSHLQLKYGPYFAYGIGGKTTIDNVKYNTFSDLRRFDAGFDLHINFEFDQFVVGLEGRAGISKLDKDFDANNVAGFFNFGYRIPFSK